MLELTANYSSSVLPERLPELPDSKSTAEEHIKNSEINSLLCDVH